MPEKLITFDVQNNISLINSRKCIIIFAYLTCWSVCSILNLLNWNLKYKLSNEYSSMVFLFP